MVFRLTPRTVIQTLRSWPLNSSGSPEANPSATRSQTLLLRNASRKRATPYPRPDRGAGANATYAMIVTGRATWWWRGLHAISHQTRQAVGRTMGWPGLQVKARWNSGMLAT